MRISKASISTYDEQCFQSAVSQGAKSHLSSHQARPFSSFKVFGKFVFYDVDESVCCERVVVLMCM